MPINYKGRKFPTRLEDDEVKGWKKLIINIDGKELWGKGKNMNEMLKDLYLNLKLHERKDK